MSSIDQHLKNKEIILLDGGVSTEIQRRGVAMDDKVWSGIAHMSHPDTVREVHEAYIHAGAQVITANTFATARHVLESLGLDDEIKSINQRAVQLAREARDNAATSETWIAGSMSSMSGLGRPRKDAMTEQAAASYRELAEILAEAGVDLIIAEMMKDPVNAPLVIEAALATGLSVWIGYSVMLAADGGRVLSWRMNNADETFPPDDFSALVAAISPLGGSAAGVMHSRVADIPPALEIMERHWTGPKLAYAETGRLEAPDWVFEEICPPDAYAVEVEQWLGRYGVQIIGGCCGTGPEHIRVLKERVQSKALTV